MPPVTIWFANYRMYSPDCFYNANINRSNKALMQMRTCSSLFHLLLPRGNKALSACQNGIMQQQHLVITQDFTGRTSEWRLRMLPLRRIHYIWMSECCGGQGLILLWMCWKVAAACCYHYIIITAPLCHFFYSGYHTFFAVRGKPANQIALF